MVKACELSRNNMVRIDGAPYVVEELRVSTPSARGAATLFRFRFRNLLTKAKLDQTCKGDDKFDEIECLRREVQYLYRQQDSYVFMNLIDFSQFTLSAEVLGDLSLYLVENMEEIQALVVDGTPLTIELPASVTLEIAECEPSMRGQSATARGKPARMTTGLVVQVPEYIASGDRVRVDTRSGEFQGRA